MPIAFLAALLYEQRSPLESLQIAIVLLPFGIPMLGILWLYPLSRETLSVRKFLFASLWFVVTLVPALGLMTAADALLGTQLPVFREFNAPTAVAESGPSDKQTSPRADTAP